MLPQLSNELWFVLAAVISLSAAFCAGRLGGKSGLLAYVALCVLLMNIAAGKVVELNLPLPALVDGTFGWAWHSWPIDAGTPLYAGVFLATDMLTEHFGAKTARKAVWYGFGAALFMVAAVQPVLHMAAAQWPENLAYATAFATVFGFVPRIVVASLITFIIAQQLDIWLFNRLKTATAGRHLWLRNNGSTALSQLADSTLFSVLAFGNLGLLVGEPFAAAYGLGAVLPWAEIGQMIVVLWVVKLAIALSDTLFMYLSLWLPPRGAQELKTP